MKVDGSQVRIRSCRFAVPALGANAVVLADTAMVAGATTLVSVLAGQPDVPRNLSVKGNDANVAGNVVIVGLDAEGSAVNETIALAGLAVVVGNKAFARVSSITLPVYAVANTERVRVGTGAKLGLPVRLSRNTVIAAFRAGAREATLPTVTVSASVLASNTATLNSALNGSDVVIDLYETE